MVFTLINALESKKEELMKGIKNIIYSMLLVLAAVCLSACSFAKDPTKSEVTTVLKETGYISNVAETNSKSTYTYSVVVEETKRSVSGNSCSVKSILTEKVGPMSTTTVISMEFNLKDDKKNWLVDRNTISVVSKESVLTRAITDATALRLAKKYYYTLQNRKIYSDQIKSAKLTGEPQILDGTELSCSVPVEISAVEGIYSKTFGAVLTIRYSPGFEKSEGDWVVDSALVDETSVVQTYANAYKVDIDTDALANYISFKDEPIYVLGQTYKTRDKDVKIENVYCDEIVPSGEVNINVPTTFDMVVNDDLRVTCRSTMEFHFVKEWQPYYLYNIEVVGIKGNFSGAWTGTMKKGTAYVTIDITDMLNEDGYPLAEVEINSNDPELGVYSWTAQLREYKTRDQGYMRVEFIRWKDLPKTKNLYGYDNFIGKIENDKWIPVDSWYDFEFRRVGVEK